MKNSGTIVLACAWCSLIQNSEFLILNSDECRMTNSGTIVLALRLVFFNSEFLLLNSDDPYLSTGKERLISKTLVAAMPP